MGILESYYSDLEMQMTNVIFSFMGYRHRIHELLHDNLNNIATSKNQRNPA